MPPVMLPINTEQLAEGEALGDKLALGLKDSEADGLKLALGLRDIEAEGLRLGEAD